MIEIVLKKGDGAYAVTPAQLDRWQEDYPDLNVLAELRRMRAWCEANTANRKTRGGFLRFVVSWLNRSQNNRSRLPAVPFPPRETAEERQQRLLAEHAHRRVAEMLARQEAGHAPY